MAAPRPVSWTQDARARRVQARLSTVFMLLGLVAAAGAQYAYRQMVQAPACHEYAQRKNLPDAEHLRFTGVRPAAKERIHICYFHNERLNTPVVLHFDRADIPGTRDAGHIITVIATFALFILLGRWRWRRWLARNGYTLPGGFRLAGADA